MTPYSLWCRQTSLSVISTGKAEICPGQGKISRHDVPRDDSVCDLLCGEPQGTARKDGTMKKIHKQQNRLLFSLSILAVMSPVHPGLQDIEEGLIGINDTPSLGRRHTSAL